jgi:riboflavin kinase/FMN adenylyltransferase
MELVRLESLDSPRFSRSTVAVGNFDGVHRGHQELVRVAIAGARELGGPAVVLTFDPHPARVLHPERAPVSLLTLDQKVEKLAALGVDRLALLRFDAALAAMEPEEFAESALARALDARVVVVGSHFRFGRARKGDLAALRAAGESLGFRVKAVAAIREGERPVSSSWVRDALASGDVRLAAALLGGDYAVDGLVVRGAGRGRGLGIPTANLDVENELLPGEGVYAGLVLDRDEKTPLAYCVANVGRRPTFGAPGIVVEAHLLDFEGDLYGRRLRLAFKARLREERRFPDARALVAQIRDDVARARAILEKAV